MSATDMSLQGAKLWLAPVFFAYDIGSASARNLPIGAYGEIRTASVRGLGVIARTQLTQQELSRFSELTRNLLMNPFNYLVREFEVAWAQAMPGDALRFLWSRHSSALYLKPPSERELPPQYRSPDSQDDRLLATARIGIESYFVSQLEEEMLRIVWEEPNTFEQLKDVRIPRTNRIQVEELLAA